MTVADLVSRVTLHCLAAIAALAAGAGWLAGLPGAAGVAAGGAIALLHFRLVARGAAGVLRGEGGFTLVSVTSSGNSVCTGAADGYRVDTPAARSFLAGYLPLP